MRRWHPVILSPRGNEMAFPAAPCPPLQSRCPQGCSCLMAATVLALVLGWWLVAASGAQKLPRPSLSLHPSRGVSLGDAVTLRCHLPPVQAWVQLWLNGTLRCDKEKDQERDVAEFSFAVTNLEDVGTYQCRYQVSEPVWTSELSDPVELMLAGAEVSSRGNLAAWGCAAALIFGLSLCFILDAWTWRDESPGLTPRMSEPMPFQVSPLKRPSQCHSRCPPGTARI